MASLLFCLGLLVTAPSAWANPSATTGAVSDITSTSARVTGSGTWYNATNFSFFWRDTSISNVSYSTLADNGARQGSGSSSFSVQLTNLSPSTTYAYWLFARESGNNHTGEGQRLTFRTLAATPAPTPESSNPPAQTTPQPSPSVPAPAVTTPLPATPAPEAIAETPRVQRSVGLEPTRGTVLVRRPGAGFTSLKDGDVIPTGSVVDTTRGSVALTSALPGGGKQTGTFAGGTFQVRQARSGMVDLYLKGPISCPARSGRAASAAARRKGRRLFGRDKGGKFRTHGKHSQATVRGTRWMVEDRCDGTLTRVTEGAVAVRDLARKRTILIKAGGRYLARPKR